MVINEKITKYLITDFLGLLSDIKINFTIEQMQADKNEEATAAKIQTKMCFNIKSPSTPFLPFSLTKIIINDALIKYSIGNGNLQIEKIRMTIEVEINTHIIDLPNFSGFSLNKSKFIKSIHN